VPSVDETALTATGAKMGSRAAGTIAKKEALPRKGDGKQRTDADFVANLQRNIAELRECIIGRLTPYPQLQVLWWRRWWLQVLGGEYTDERLCLALPDVSCG